MNETRLVEVRQQVLKKNDVAARALRGRFREAGVYVVSLVSSPGAGKTALLEKLLGLLRERFRVAALVGDLATDNDARRRPAAGQPAGGDGRRRPGRLGAGRARLPVRRERRQPGL